jgi:hypothetical protein
MRMQIRHITPNNTIKFCMPITIRDKHSNAARVSVPLHQLEACLQMLQPFEAHTLNSDDCSILIRCDRLNQFTLDFVEPKNAQTTLLQAVVNEHGSGMRAPTADDLTDLTPAMHALQHTSCQILPLFATASSVSAQIQAQSSSSLLPMCQQVCAVDGKPWTDMRDMRARSPWNWHCKRNNMPAYFLKDNASIMSRLTDIFNTHQTKKHSYKYTARLAHLGALFCATASPHSQATCFNVSALSKFTPSQELLTLMRETPPLKQGLTVLTKGSDKSTRVLRHNLTVRMYARDSEVARQLSSNNLDLNADVQSDILVVSGPHNEQLSILFLGNETTTPGTLEQMQARFYASM